MKKGLFFALLFIVPGQYVLADEYIEMVAYRDALKEKIAAVESETDRCEKSLKGWKIATIIGGVGAVASGVGIIAQKHQVKENEKVLNEIAEEKKNSDVLKDVMQEVKK